jgi:integrase/recombinase XerD
MTGVRFLFRITLRRHDLAAEVYHIKEPVILPLTLSPEEARRLLTCAGSLRLKVMLALAYGCGLRVGEVARLRAGDIDSAQGIIRVVQSKGRKDRHVMLPEEVLELLRQWWKERPARLDTGIPPLERLVFPSRKAGKPLTIRQLNRLFHQACEAVGIQKPLTLHSLRHSFATHLLEQGTDIKGAIALWWQAQASTLTIVEKMLLMAAIMIAGIVPSQPGANSGRTADEAF